MIMRHDDGTRVDNDNSDIYNAVVVKEEEDMMMMMMMNGRENSYQLINVDVS